MQNSKMYRIGIIGAGLIGGKRAAALSSDKCKLVAVSDLNLDRAQVLATQHQAEVEKNPKDLISRKDLDIVIIATTNDAIPALALGALEAGKHVLIEKPGGRNPEELHQLKAAAQRSRGILRVGFNHRFHPGLQKAKTLMGGKEFGPLMYIRARYGHGGRIGYDREWRADPKLGGGGELLDQGVHLIDLCRWLGGEFDLEYGKAHTFFWDMPVEDNGFLILNSPDKKRTAFLHASCSEWKNIFDFELFGRHAKLQVFGLGRSYGVEELRHYQMKPEMGPPDIKIESFPGDDHSWNLEFDAFLKEIDGEKTDIGTIEDAVRAVEIVYQTYAQSNLKWNFD
jgi:predicted dehydrogenase